MVVDSVGNTVVKFNSYISYNIRTFVDLYKRGCCNW